MKKSIIAAIALISAISSSAYAANVDYNRETGEVLVSGDKLEYGASARMIVLKPNADLNALISGEKTFSESCIYADELKQTNESGEYSFKKFVIKDGTPAGEYKIIIKLGGQEDTAVINYASVKQTLDFIMSADTPEEVRALIEKYNDEVYKLNIGENSEFSKLDTDGQNYVLDKLRGKSYTDITALNSEFEKMTNEYIKEYTENAFREVSGRKTAAEVRAAIEKYSKIYGLVPDENESFKAFSESEKTAVYERMTDEVYTSTEEINKAFMQKTVLQLIEKGPWGSIPGYIKSYNDILGLNLSKYSETNAGLLKSLVGKRCKTPSDLQSLIDGYKAPEAGGSGGGGGGGGGGYSAGSGITPSGSITNTPNTAGGQNEERNSAFSDVPINHWAFSYIDALYKRDIVSGKESGIFAPDDFVTRAEAVKLIMSAIAKNMTADESISFKDSVPGSWEYEYVSAAAANNIATGYGDGYFGCSDNITRQDFCVMIYRAMKLCGYKTERSDLAFSDNDMIEAYAKEAVESLLGMGIISGMGDGSFKPNANTTRAQAAKIIYSVIK